MEIKPTAIYQISGKDILNMAGALAKHIMEAVKSEAKQDTWISQKKAMIRLEVAESNNTKMAALRESGKIKFKKVGRKYLYSVASIEQFLNG